ncbi:MAG: MBL fold metallo-hydrolase [Candidatus Melainabacteria bacterium]|nr:MAG: MBL fold metallo-hydrolase [Candidatus Melainabacteria bacterium]
MLKIKQYPTNYLSVNTYLVCDDVSKECIIIDLGGEIDKIYKDIKRIWWQVEVYLKHSRSF